MDNFDGTWSRPEEKALLCLGYNFDDSCVIYEMHFMEAIDELDILFLVLSKGSHLKKYQMLTWIIERRQTSF